jgi:GNAT superfamily N-acetyltransferase
MRSLRQVKLLLHKAARRAAALLPRRRRYRLLRSLIHCDLAPDPRLVLKVADTRDELEACYRLLHDAYVDAGLMRPDPSGLRLTIYHALPTTTTLCALIDGQVIGTVSVITESAFGLPLQRVFDLSSVRARRGRLAEVSALAVDPVWRGNGGAVLFALMKLVFAYCTQCLDTRHLVAAVHPGHVEMYESLLFFRRLTGRVVDRYDYVNGAPAIGLTLDLKHAPEILRKYYGDRAYRRNLYHYFVEAELPGLRLPERRSLKCGEPVLTPGIVDHFFNHRTQLFASLDERRKALLHLIYDLPDYRRMLPPLAAGLDELAMRRHRRFSVRRPGRLHAAEGDGEPNPMQVTEVSRYGFRARTSHAVGADGWLIADIQLGPHDLSRLHVLPVQESRFGEDRVYGFRIGEPDLAWRKFVNALYDGRTADDLDHASLQSRA